MIVKKSELNLLDCFRGKKILITGHTGFKGSNIYMRIT